MAKKEETPKTVLERIYNVPLRREYQKAPNWKRTPKAVKALRQFISKHMKSENIIIGRYANELLWKNGMKNPPHHVKVNAIKDEKGKVVVELVELPGRAKREEAKLKELDKKKDKKEVKKEEEAKAVEKKEEKIEDKVDEKKGKEEKTKALEQEGIKELKKEIPKQAPKPVPVPKQVQQQPTAPKGK